MPDLSELFTCPRCQTPNFTRRGLKSHVCRKNDRKPLPKEEVDAAIAGGSQKGPMTVDLPDQAPTHLATLTIFAFKRGQDPIVTPSRDNADFLEARQSPSVAWVLPVYGENYDAAVSAAKQAFSVGKGILTEAGQREGLKLPTAAAATPSEVPGLKDADFVPKAPAGTLVVDEADTDALMGAQLMAQWEVVKSGQKQQLVFGAMMLKVRERVDSARGANSAKRGPGTKGTGLKAWLEQHAPKVSEGSAYRMMEVTEGIRDDLKIGKTVDLEELLATALEDLPEKLAKKREQIDKVIEGKSQRQLLLEFGKGPDKRGENPGGFRPNAEYLRLWLKEQYPDHPEYLEFQLFSELPEEIQKRYLKEGQRYEERLPKEKKEAIQHAADARAWCEQIVPAITLGIDQGYFLACTEEQYTHLIAAVKDLQVHVGKMPKPKAAKALPEK